MKVEGRSHGQSTALPWYLPGIRNVVWKV